MNALLDERGAEINAASSPWTPLDDAINNGKPAITDYLRSVGSKTGDELRDTAGKKLRLSTY